MARSPTTASADLYRARRNWRFRRAAALPRGGHGEGLLVESRLPGVVRRRERFSRRALVVADASAGLLVIGMVMRVFPSASPGWTTLALLPLIVVTNATSGLYSRDELRLRKSTLDEA